MIRSLVCCAIPAIWVLSQPALAQTTEEDFCSLMPKGLLTALDGTWTVSQGTGIGKGVGQAGGIVFPVPGQPGKTFSLNVDAENMVAFLRADGQELVLTPVPDFAATAATANLSEAQREGLLKIGDDGCDWSAAPIMLGSNEYELDGPGNRVLSVAYSDQRFLFCGNLMVVDDRGYYEYNTHAEVEVKEDVANRCARNGRPVAAEGDLVMSLAVRFQSATYGTGVVQFSSVYDGYSAEVMAPVVFTR